MSVTADLLDRAAGSLWGLAVGDALGMPTQLLSRREILQTYGEITGFETPSASHPIASGLAAGAVTDDTEQAILLGELLQPDAHLDQRAWGEALLSWEDRMRAKGSLDLLGPSTRAALTAFRSGTPVTETGAHGTTNGAAMRIAPVGLAVPPNDLGRLVDRVVEASMLSHNTSLALAGAAAVAAAVSSCVEGVSIADAVAVAVQAAELAAERGRWVAGATVARRLAWAVDYASDTPARDLLNGIPELVGTSLATQESVPAAFAVLVAFPDSPWRAVCAAASLGGDSDTIAAIVGAVAGAAHGVGGFPAEALRTVREVNDIPLATLAARLLDIRCP